MPSDPLTDKLTDEERKAMFAALGTYRGPIGEATWLAARDFYAARESDAPPNEKPREWIIGKYSDTPGDAVVTGALCDGVRVVPKVAAPSPNVREAQRERDVLADHLRLSSETIRELEAERDAAIQREGPPSYRARLAERDEARDRVTALEAALRELVRLKDEKSQRQGTGLTAGANRDYQREKDAAWDQARAALDALPSRPEGEEQTTALRGEEDG